VVSDGAGDGAVFAVSVSARAPGVSDDPLPAAEERFGSIDAENRRAGA
jgi:hypothetical protein